MYKTITGAYSEKTPVGWCHNNIHRGALTAKQLQRHKCLKRKCRFFEKNADSIYWEQRKKQFRRCH